MKKAVHGMIVCREALDQLSPTCSTVQESKKHKTIKKAYKKPNLKFHAVKTWKGNRLILCKYDQKYRVTVYESK